MLFLLLLVQIVILSAMSLFEPLYHGDVPLEKYICAHRPSKWSFVYIHTLHELNEDFNTSFKNNQTLSSNFYLSKKTLPCFTAVYGQINSSALLASLQSKFGQHTQVLITIRLPSSKSSTIATYLERLNFLYNDCSECLPFLLLLPPNATLDSLKKALTLAKLNSTLPLRAVLTFAHFQNTTTVHLNPVLDGCAQQNNGLFHPQSDHDFERLRATKCNLNGSVLRVAINDDLSHCNFPNGAKDYPLTNSKTLVNDIQIFGYDVDLLRLLQQKYHFQTRLLYAKQIYSAQYNSQLSSWTGVVGHVYSGSAHFGLCGLSDTLERRKYVGFTIFTNIDSFSSVTRFPRLKSRQWLAVEPFSGSVWMLIGASFSLTLATLVLPPVFYRVTSAQKAVTFLGTVEELYRILLQSCECI